MQKKLGAEASQTQTTSVLSAKGSAPPPNFLVHGDRQNVVPAVVVKNPAYEAAIQGLNDPNTTHVELKLARLDDEQIKNIANLIKDHLGVRVLSLHGTKLSEQAVVYIANAIAAHPTLLELDLGGCQISTQGALYLAEALKANRYLRRLNLERNNKIDDQAGIALARALEQNNTLMSLILNDTAITTIGAERLVRALENNVSLYELSFGTLKISDVMKAQIEMLRQRNQKKRDEFLAACASGNKEKCELLLEEGVNIQAADRQGNTGLHVAAQHGQLEMVEFLLAQNAVLVPNEARKTPLQIAEEHNQIQIAALLRTRPSAYVPIAKNLRRLWMRVNMNAEQKEFLHAVVDDMERLQNESKQVMMNLEHDMHTALNQNQEEVEQVAGRLDTLEAKVQNQMDAQNQEIARLKSLFKQGQVGQAYKAWRDEAVNRFNRHANSWVFYRSLLIKLEEIFIGCRTVASHFVSHAMEGDIAKIGNGVQLLGQILSYVPAVGAAAQTATDQVHGAMKDVDYKRQLTNIEQLSRLLTNKEQKKLAEILAILFTLRFEKQLLVLRQFNIHSVEGEEDQRSLLKRLWDKSHEIKKASDELLYKAYKLTNIQKLAEFAALRILEGLRSDTLSEFSRQIAQNPAHLGQKTMEEHIADIIFERIVTGQIDFSLTEKSKHHVHQLLSETVGHGTIQTEDNRVWILKEVFIKAGIETTTGQQYTPVYANPVLYGYRLGTPEEIQKLRAAERAAPKLTGHYDATAAAASSSASSNVGNTSMAKLLGDNLSKALHDKPVTAPPPAKPSAPAKPAAKQSQPIPVPAFKKP